MVEGLVYDLAMTIVGLTEILKADEMAAMLVVMMIAELKDLRAKKKLSRWLSLVEKLDHWRVDRMVDWLVRDLVGRMDFIQN